MKFDEVIALVLGIALAIAGITLAVSLGSGMR